MTNITTIPIEELYTDRQDSVRDIHLCTAAVMVGIETYGDKCSVQERLNTSKAIVARIDEELARRKEKPE